ERVVDRPPRLPVGRADEQDGYTLSVQPPRHERAVRVVDQVSLLLQIGYLHLEPGNLLLRTVELPPERVSLGVAQAVRCEGDADQDPDHEREEDGRERRDVIAEIEHA